MTEIENVRHLGLVDAGADEHAKRLPGGQLAAQLIASEEKPKPFLLNKQQGVPKMKGLQLTEAQLKELCTLLGVECLGSATN